MGNTIKHNSSPVVVGGVGGSGTRLIANCLHKLNYHLGSYLNESLDNLWFTLLFKRVEILTASKDEFAELLNLFIYVMRGGSEFSPEQVKFIESLAVDNRMIHSQLWLKTIAKSFTKIKQHASTGQQWGWKEPNSHIVLQQLRARIPNLKYIHVVRNGLDMAYSDNQNQLIFWGKHYLDREFAITPYDSLAFWCKVQQNIMHIGNTMGDNFLLLNYDEFCTNPTQGIKSLCDFLGINSSENIIQLLFAIIKQPKSIGRFKQYATDVFASKDIAYVKSLGFPV
ncbi:MAG: sulfotransferase [Proteobacteria bacterium]|nr:sulfotransferase [Pseudomonadota bacterium]